MENKNIILVPTRTGHPTNIDVDGKVLLKQRRNVKPQHVHHHHHHHQTAEQQLQHEAAPVVPVICDTKVTKPIYIRQPVKTKRSGSWHNQYQGRRKSKSSRDEDDVTPVALSSPTLFVDHRCDDIDASGSSQPEVTSSSCGSLHFEVVPPTPKKTDQSSSSCCNKFNFDDASIPPNVPSSVSIDELTISSDNEDEEMEDELRTPKVFFSGPMFLMPNIRDPDLSSRQVKDRVEKAMADPQGLVGSTYLQVPMNVPRRRHSWICG
jgi:hypothetical protein